jgi:hypothetical protein
MERAWKPFVLAVVLEFATISFVHGRLVPFVSDTHARDLARSYSVMPQFNHVNRSDRSAPDSDGWPESDRGKASVIVCYMVMLELLAAVFAALGSLLMLALAGIVVKVQERSRAAGAQKQPCLLGSVQSKTT